MFVLLAVTFSHTIKVNVVPDILSFGSFSLLLGTEQISIANCVSRYPLSKEVEDGLPKFYPEAESLAVQIIAGQSVHSRISGVRLASWVFMRIAMNTSTGSHLSLFSPSFLCYLHSSIRTACKEIYPQFSLSRICAQPRRSLPLSSQLSCSLVFGPALLQRILLEM